MLPVEEKLPTLITLITCVIQLIELESGIVITLARLSGGKSNSAFTHVSNLIKEKLTPYCTHQQESPRDAILYNFVSFFYIKFINGL
jgi:hypothetical protein